MNNTDREIARSRWVEQMAQSAQAEHEARREAAPRVDLAGMSPSQALGSVFGSLPAPTAPRNYDRPRDQHDGKPHQAGLRLGDLRDGIAPAAPPAPAPAEPGQEPPARLADVWERLAAPPAAASPATPSAAVRRALAGLPEVQQQEIEKAVVQRLGGLGHLSGESADYRQALVIGHLAGRLADARRLAPDVSAADVLLSLLPAPAAPADGGSS